MYVCMYVYVQWQHEVHGLPAAHRIPRQQRKRIRRKPEQQVRHAVAYHISYHPSIYTVTPVKKTFYHTFTFLLFSILF